MLLNFILPPLAILLIALGAWGLLRAYRRARGVDLLSNPPEREGDEG